MQLVPFNPQVWYVKQDFNKLSVALNSNCCNKYVFLMVILIYIILYQQEVKETIYFHHFTEIPQIFLSVPAEKLRLVSAEMKVYFCT